MKFNKDKCLGMDKKVHYKMYKAGKMWLVAGIATFGFGLSMSVGAADVKAVSKSDISLVQGNKGLNDIDLSQGLLKNVNKKTLSDSIENYSQEPSFSQQFSDQKLSEAPVKTGAIKAGKDRTGNLQLTYFNGRSGANDLVSQVGSSRGWGEVHPRGQNPFFMAPNFSIRKGDGSIWSWVYRDGSLDTSTPFFAGINNDWKTADHGSNWRIWSIEQGPTPGMIVDPNDSKINSQITVKFTGDFKFNTENTYTLDFTMTLKPNGSNVDYGLSVRNVTSIVNPGISGADATLPGFWFGSQYDTMMGSDSVPLFFTGSNQGLYLKYGGYKLKFNYTSKDAPTGWGAGRYAQTFASVGINSPSDAGQKGLNAAKDTVAFDGGDSGLYMVWKPQDLTNGDSRNASYQASISSETAVLPVVKLDKPEDNYTGGPYTVSGKASYQDTDISSRPLKYYYIVDDSAPVEFEGPQDQDTAEHPFSFTIPAGKMEIGNEHQISVYAVDNYGVSGETQFMKLTAHAEIKTKESSYFVGDKFDKFSSFDGGEKVDGTAIARDDITDVQVKDASGRVVNDLDHITDAPGTYTVIYTYRYGSGEKGGSVSATGTINVYSPDDPNHGADFILRDRTYYVGDPFNADDSFVSGRKNGSEPMIASDLMHAIKNELGVEVSDADVTRVAGNYEVTYKYPYGNNGQTIEKKIVIRIIEAKHITLNYIDDAGNPIDARFLTGVTDSMKKGDHTGRYGSEFNITPAQTLDNAYNFVRAEQVPGQGVAPVPIPNNKLVFGESDQVVNLVYQGAPIADDASNAVTVHHYLKDVNGNETTTTVPGMSDTHRGGRVGQKLEFKLTDPEQVAADGYELVAGQSDQSWVLRPDQGKEITFYYKAKKQDNITIDFVDAKTGDVISSQKPGGTHYTGDELDLGSRDVTSKVPAGYHVAEGNELNGHTQPSNPKYTTQDQRHQVFIVGDKVEDNATNAVTVHHYLKDTTTTVPGMSDTHRGGRVGDVLEFNLTDPEQQAPAGYQLAEGQQNQSWKLKHDEGKTIVFYYEAKTQDNITIEFVDASTGETVIAKKPGGTHHTGEELDLNSTDVTSKIPAGYHIAKGSELNGNTQPSNPKYTTEDQTTKVFIIGDKIADDATNAVTVHHYLKDTTTPVPGMNDIHKGGRVGQKLEFKLTDREQQAPNGYELSAGQTDQTWTLKHDEGKTIIFYYEGSVQDNITIDFVDASTGKSIAKEKPAGTHRTGDELDLGSTDVTSKIPDGYHVAEGDELNGNTQPSNPKYTTSDQTKKVFIVGNKVEDNATNAVTVVHYLKDANGNNTTTPVPGMNDIHKGGRVGQTLKFKLTDPEQKAPKGYQLSAGQTDQEWTLKADEGKTIIFYYEAKSQDNITIQFGDAMNPDKVIGTTKPTGHHTGEELDLNSDEVKSKVPKGYHVATKDELNGLKDKDGKPLGQPSNPEYTTTPQAPTLWIIGDKIADDATNAVTVRHYLKGTTTPVPGMNDIHKGGRVGETLKFKLTDNEQEAPTGYELSAGQTDQEWTLTPDGGKEIIFYYNGSSSENITIIFKDTDDNTVGTSVPKGHRTGDVLEISEDGLKGNVPKGYHVATKEELKDLKDANGKQLSQPENPKYTTSPQSPTLWIIGDKIAADSENAVTVRHYLKGTTTPVPGMNDIHKGGRVGETLKFKLTDDEQKAPKGYKLAPDQTDQEWTLSPEGGKEIIFYYTADSLDNITVEFIDVTTGKKLGSTKPTGHHTGEELDLNGTEVTSKIPAGYHIAKGDELNGKEQPKNPKYTTEDQTKQIFIIGDIIENDAKNAVTV
ncbi:KxYKxGKxW signal peptide domain-containing protein, partial [Lactobacillus sp.]|uniref:KxYKxGKxW signal peptide domain-containing protein n=1 Tax=Lactobacillus sp. TaxID=1591 RepID=UPI002584C2EB